MKQVREGEQVFRGGDRGVKYMFRGPKLDWGVILLKPGDRMEAHGHKVVEETFYVIEGEGSITVDGKEFPARAGDAFYVPPPERHGLSNGGSADMKVIFIKTPYLPEDRI